LAGGIAHDFNNILSGIIGYVELAARARDAAVRKKHMDKILATADRARHLVTQILAFSRHVEHSKNHVDIKHIVKDALGLLRSTIPANIDIRRSMPDFPLVVYGDATQMHQVIMNICTNAVHAMGQKGGVLDVNLTREDIAHGFLSETINLKPGGYVKLSIADTGHGIDPSIMNRLFDPFFTTKKIGEGTGLGLSVVYGIVKDHDGGINVSSAPGEGATFEVYLPYIEEKATAEKPSLDETPPGGTEHILFVDDEQALVELARENLQDMGYRVSAFSDSRQALNAYLERPDAFDLVITDMTMPYLSGSDLSRAILDARPQQSIILYTGFSDYMDDEKAAQLAIKAFLLKPLNRQSLALAIRKALDQ
jgi:CheY-like chemotaxis protein